MVDHPGIDAIALYRFDGSGQWSDNSGRDLEESL